MGIPDRLLLGQDGQLGFVELKHYGQSPTIIQLQVHKLLENRGFGAYVIHSTNRFNRLLDSLSESP